MDKKIKFEKDVSCLNDEVMFYININKGLSIVLIDAHGNEVESDISSKNVIALKSFLNEEFPDA